MHVAPRRRPLAALVPLLAVTACASAKAGDAADASSPADAALVDAGTAPVDASGDAAACDVGAVPSSVPQLVGKVVVAGVADGGAPPAMTGGDETGLWGYSAITLYLEQGAPVDPAASKIEGSGWLALSGGAFRQYVDTVTTLSTSVVGVVVRGNDTRARGAYAKSGASLTFTPECRESSTADTTSTGTPTYAFTRVDATHAQLLVTGTTTLGPYTLLTELTKAD